MLIEFRVENFRSIRDEQVLTMAEGRVDEPSAPWARAIPGHDENLLPVAGIYGANASGKSNVLGALSFMSFAVEASHRLWQPEEGVPREPFAWGEYDQKPSAFEIAIVLQGIRYEYGFRVNDRRCIEEWVWAYPNGRRQVWFEREEDVYHFGEHLRGENKLIQGVTRPNALFLSVAAQHNHDQLSPLFRWFARIRFHLKDVSRIHSDMPLEFMLANQEDRQMSLFTNTYSGSEGSDYYRLRALLRAADVGIVDVRVARDEELEGSRDIQGQRKRRSRIMLRHEMPDGEAWLRLEQESRGTQTLLRLAPLAFKVLREGGVLVIDEIEASLHPLLSLKIVQLFNDPATNPRNAQLIFSTHDTNLLNRSEGAPALRRDQIWFTEKDKEGATRLYPLTDYKPRKAENLERGYLQGRYGAIPYLGDFTKLGGGDDIVEKD